MPLSRHTLERQIQQVQAKIASREKMLAESKADQHKDTTWRHLKGTEHTLQVRLRAVKAKEVLTVEVAERKAQKEAEAPV